MGFTESGTIDDLVADADQAGYKITHRLVHDWVSNGLLDRPQRRRTGATGSEKGLYTAQQRQLLLDLLQLRVMQPKIPFLARLPLLIWLREKDPIVPTRQALRALKIYVGDPRGSKSQARSRALELTTPFCDHPELGTALERRELLDVCRDALYTGRLDRDRFLAKARPLFEPVVRYLAVARSVGATVPGQPEGLLLQVEVGIAAGQFVSADIVTADLLEKARRHWVWMYQNREDARSSGPAVQGLMTILGVYAILPETIDRRLPPWLNEKGEQVDDYTGGGILTLSHLTPLVVAYYLKLAKPGPHAIPEGPFAALMAAEAKRGSEFRQPM